MFNCEQCDTKFKRLADMNRHKDYCKKKQSVGKPKIICDYCSENFKRKDALLRHLDTCKRHKVAKKRKNSGESSEKLPLSEQGPTPVKKKRIMRCDLCDIDVADYHNHLRSADHKNKVLEEEDEYVFTIQSAYKSRIATYKVLDKNTMLTPEDFLQAVKQRVIKLINRKQTEVGSAVKVNFELFAMYTKTDDDDKKEMEDMKSFNTKNCVITLNDSDMNAIYDSFVCALKTKADEFQEKDSGWALNRIVHLEVNINKYEPLKGSSYIPLPSWVQKKRAVVNVKNLDDACFAWAVTSALYPAKKNADRISSYSHYSDVLNLKGITFPVTLSDITQFEGQNEVSINVYELDGKNISGPLYFTKEKRARHVNLLYHESKCGQAHYSWIKNLSRLVSSQISKHDHKIWICDGCLLSFVTEDKLIEHCNRDCSQIKTTVPTVGNNTLKFKNYCHQLRTPVIVYADFEALLTPIDERKSSKLESFTQDYQRHEPYSFGYYIKCSYDDSKSKYVSYIGNNCAETFLQSLEKELTPFAQTILEGCSMHRLTKTQRNAYRSAVQCHICKEDLGSDKVRDHCHLTGEFRGAAHPYCNLNYKIKKVIPIVFHNFTKYDSHFIIKALKDHNVNILPKNKENFISLTLKLATLGVELRFIDSYRFLATSLDKLASNLESDQFHTIKKHFPKDLLDLVIKKGVFPYDYMDSLDKLNETKLPDRKHFYNRLNNYNISDAEYSHAQKIWNAFNIKTIAEYSDLYLKTDVLLLTDIFENFREVCLKMYALDPAHYYTAPGLSWDAMLKETKISLELLTDISMIKFITRGIRGGLSQCCVKHAVANNKYMQDYNQAQSSSYIIYLDANNQYGWAMSQYLPFKDFNWLTEAEIANLNVEQLSLQAETGYFLEVDLDYPSHLHNLHNDLCFCPDNRVPDISKSKTSKLMSNLYSKKNYVIHYVNLKQAISHGLVLKKIHRVLSFTQSQWLKHYIDLNSQMRVKAKNSFEKDFFKLMNNAVFGKTMENVDKRVDVRLVTKWESEGRRLGARALISRLNFRSCTIIDEDLTVFQMNRIHVKYDKPIYIGFTVLELSKTLMFEFHYDYILPKYGDDVELLYTDTDSFIYKIKTDDFYNDIRPDLAKRFDTSDFIKSNIYKLPLVNKKIVGMMKDECAGTIIREFIGIRSKCYYVKKGNDEEIKKSKGIKKDVVRKDVFRSDYYNCVSDQGSVQYRTMNVIRSKSHVLYSQTLNKIALKNHDDKRFQIPNNPLKTLAWGHKDISKYNLA